MDAFLAIEKILHFHHTTTAQPLRVAMLRLRCFRNGTAVSQNDIDAVLRIWPEAYRLYTSRGNLVIEAQDLPQNVEQRRETFARHWAEKENKAAGENKDTAEETGVARLETSSSRQPLRNIHKPILMGRLKKEPVNRSLNLLDRIRIKEAKLRQDRTPAALQRDRDMFLKSQIPKLKRVLDELANSQGSRSLEMQEMMDIMRTNLFKLGDDEIRRVLHLIVQMYPTFCSIVTVGSATHVKLQKQKPSMVC